MAASPVLIGATTVLIALVAVFIAYNANSGLPFVPTYDLKAELRRLAVNAPPFAKPLRQFLQTIDDRKRAIETDVRAKASSPPAPDPTHISGEGGFTGMEAVWNYFFWQTLSINMLDDGSNPGAAKLRVESGQPATSIGEQRGEGMPEAGPLPGQPDLSKPQITLPPDVQELLDSLTPRQRQELGTDLPTNPDDLKRKLDSLGAPAPTSDQTTGQLLDYLLAP